MHQVWTFDGFTGERFPFRRDLAGVDLTLPFPALNVLAYVRTLWALRVGTLTEPSLSPSPGLRVNVA